MLNQKGFKLKLFSYASDEESGQDYVRGQLEDMEDTESDDFCSELCLFSEVKGYID